MAFIEMDRNMHLWNGVHALGVTWNEFERIIAAVRYTYRSQLRRLTRQFVRDVIEGLPDCAETPILPDGLPFVRRQNQLVLRPMLRNRDNGQATVILMATLTGPQLERVYEAIHARLGLPSPPVRADGIVLTVNYK